MAGTVAKPGPNEQDSREAVLDALEDTDVPALTVGMVVERTNYSAPTVDKRLSELVEEGEIKRKTKSGNGERTLTIESGKIGNATAYWIDERKLSRTHGMDVNPRRIGRWVREKLGV